MALRSFLRSTGLPDGDLHDLPSSTKRFPDGALYRVEIPSTEGPRCFEAVLDQAERLDVRVHRVSQGSGVFMQTDRELDELSQLARDARVEVSLFARPNAAWGLSASARTHPALAASAHGQEQVVANLEDCLRAADHGFRSVLIADLGVLDLFREARETGLLPAEMQAKVSVMLPAANPAAARVLERLGASTINLPTDLTLAQIAAVRAAVDIPLDVYVEAPDNLGGFVRHHEIPELIRVAAPVYVEVRAAKCARCLSRRHAHRGNDDRVEPRAGSPRAPRPRAPGALRLRAGLVGARRVRPRSARVTQRTEGELMARPCTLFTGQWADLPLTDLASRCADWGFDGLELACWGDHFEVDQAIADRAMRAGAASCWKGTVSASGRSAPTSWARRSAT